MKIEEVKNEVQAKQFLNLPENIYRNFPRWIRPLDKDIEAVFDSSKNIRFSDGACTRWLCKDHDGKPLGRIAAFFDYKTASKNDQPTGGIGFFESIENAEVSRLLFDTARHWLASKGMEAMDGPVNFGERDKWWGLLISGFEYEPNYCMNYNPPYYQSLFEDYGFREYFKQFTYYRKVAGGIDDSIRARAERLSKNDKYKFVNITKLSLKKVALDFQEVYNKAWSSYPDFVPMTQKQVAMLLRQIKPIMDKRLIWFGYYSDLPIAFAVMLPEVNQVFKHLNSKLDFLQQLKFLWLLRSGICTKIIGVAFGIVPRFQGRGVESAMIEAISKMAYDERKTFKYTEAEHNWVGDFNPQMMHVHELMGGTIRKTHATYRYLFDRDKEFRRAPVIGHV